MKQRTIVTLATLSLVAFMAGGCANKEVVKSEEPVVKSEPVKVAEPAPQRAEVPQVSPAPVQAAEPIKPAAVAEVTPATAPVAKSAFETVYFDFDKSDLRQDARDVLSKNAEILLKEEPLIRIQISGNCDEKGSAEYNLALGERRAKSAQQYMVTLGVPANRLSIISYGKEKPAVAGQDDTAWAKNRRDEFVIIK